MKFLPVKIMTLVRRVRSDYSERMKKIMLQSHFRLLFPLLTTAVFTFSSAFAADDIGEQPISPQTKFIVNEPAGPWVSLAPFRSPIEVAADLLTGAIKAITLPLLKWDRIIVKTGPEKKYDRIPQFGKWEQDPDTGKCYNTRTRTLIRDSKVPVTFDTKNNCLVSAGQWNDPYTGQTYTKALEIQIDHFVPLKNAFDSGAWRWSKQLRCLYANYMKNSFHLVSASGHENTVKSDQGPEGYMPPNQAFSCTYLQRWLMVKLIWHMEMNENEVLAITNLGKKFGCKESDFNISSSDLLKQRIAIQKPYRMCQ